MSESSVSLSKETDPPPPLVCSGCSLPPRRKANGEAIPLRKCTRCRVTAYHDATCQRQHYATHKQFCRRQDTVANKAATATATATATAITTAIQEMSVNVVPCYRIERRPLRGNCMIATRNIKPHEKLGTSDDIFPAVAPPVLFESQRSSHCAICFAPLQQQQQRELAQHALYDDSRYHVRVCHGCQTNHHAEMDCLRREIDAVKSNPQIPRILPTALLVYRICLALAHGNNNNTLSSWEDSLQVMIAHDDDSSSSSDDDPNAVIHQRAIVMTVASLLSHDPLARCDLERMIHRIPEILARIKVNAFTITATTSANEESLGIGLYQTAHFINHSCRPNTTQSFVVGKPGQVPSLCLTANAAGIAAHEEITIAYLDTAGVDVQERQAQLRRSYHFTCTCVACQSETSWLGCHEN